jgi:repressor of nif and glnA expression
MECLWEDAVSTPTLTRVEQAILDILEDYPGSVSARELRSRLRSRGFRRTAPALVFTMMRLEDKGLVRCLEEVREADGIEIRERCYSKNDAPT